MADFHFTWTDAQWDEFGNRIVTINLEVLNRLIDGLELLAEGRRLNAPEQHRWAEIHKDARAIIAPHIAEIDAMKVSDAQADIDCPGEHITAQTGGMQ